MKTFYLGARYCHWIGRATAPVFVTRGVFFRDRATFPKARVPWALDSGAYTELKRHGRWTLPAAQYAREAQTFHRDAGRMNFAACQDWPTDPVSLARTGRTVADHQGRTVSSYLELRALAPEVPWVPVLQGWTVEDYLAHVADHAAAGIDLKATLVGVGSLAGRQRTPEAAAVLRTLAALGLRLHAFGLSGEALARLAPLVESADSMAWSWEAYRGVPMRGHRVEHQRCINCLPYAQRWGRQQWAAVEAEQRRLLAMAS